MDLIDRYAHEVGQYLPNRLRADVEAELRSLLTDSVEEKALCPPTRNWRRRSFMVRHPRRRRPLRPAAV
jgi:hypothetical protein